MRKNPYKGLNTKELSEVYLTTKTNYGKITGDLLAEIESRGGEENFLKQVQREKILDTEKARIRKEVADLMGEHSDTAFLKKLIHSDLLTESELSQYIDSIHLHLTAHKFNRSIDAKTIVGSLTGILIGTILGAIVSGAQLLLFGTFFYISLVLIYILSWFTIRLITKKNAANIVVLLSAVAATILGPLLFFLFQMLQFKPL